MAHHTKEKVRLNDVFSLLHLPLEDRIKSNDYFRNELSPIAYIPQILGIELGKAFNLSPLIFMYLGRIMNLAAWIFLVFTAIKTTPIFKWLFCLLALSPMSLFQSASLSKDSFTIGASFLVISLSLQYAFDETKTVRIRDLFLLFFLTTLVFITKQYCFFLYLLFLLIPIRKIGSKKKYFAAFILPISLGVLAFVAWISSTRDISSFLHSNQQLHFILTHPSQYTFVILETILREGKDYLEGFIGRLGWLDTPLPQFLRFFYGTMLVFIALNEKAERVVIGFKQKMIIFFAFIFGLLLLFTGPYLFWNPVGESFVKFLQGRYFIPVGTLFFLLLYNQKIGFFRRNDRWIGMTVHMTLILMLTSTSCVIFNRYY